MARLAMTALTVAVFGCDPPAPVTPVVEVVVPVAAPTATVVAVAEPIGLCPAGMALIPGGTFAMGWASGNGDENPVHDVTVGSFCLDVTEVTSNAYADCVTQRACSADGLLCEKDTRYTNPTYRVAGKGDHPVNCVTWHQATRYCAAQNKRLPTEEEWEYAARSGGENRKNTWGNEERRDPFFCWSTQSGTCPVGAYPGDVTRWGVLDLAGNVREWTSSGYAESYDLQTDNETRSVRGESWFDTLANFIRATDRYGGEPESVTDFVGFRCALTP